MKISAAPIERSSNSSVAPFQGKLNTEKLGLFMKNLISNYNNPEIATLREWLSNAIDSHRAAGQTSPILLTLPGKFSNILSVEDFGIGMSYWDVENLYAVLLSSSKDESDDYIGGFGIGGKSALAIADQYTMVTIKNGLKSIFIFERSDTGGLQVTPALKEEPTDEPNGVKVSVAVSNTWKLDGGSVERVLEGYRPEELTVIGGEFISFYRDSLAFKHGLVKEALFTHSGDNRRGEARVFVGSASYDLPRSFWRQEGADELNMIKLFGSYFAIHLPIEKITFPSSREVIEDTPENNEAILAVARKLEKEVRKYVQKKVASLSSFEEAYVYSNSWFIYRSKTPVVYEGHDFSKIYYEGVAGIIVDINHAKRKGIRLSSMTKALFEKSPGRSTSVIVKVSEEDSDLSLDTYRKYIRGTVEEIISDEDTLKEILANSNHNVGNHYYGSQEITILITDKEHDLYPVTSVVYNYGDLKAKTLSAPRTTQSSPKLTDEQRKKRAANVEIKARVPRNGRLYDSHVRFEEHPAFKTGNPVVLVAQEVRPEVIPLLENLFDIKDRLIIVRTKLMAKHISVHFPNTVLFQDLMESAKKSEKKRQHASLERLVAVRKKFGMDAYTYDWFKEILEDKDLLPEAKALFDMEAMLAATGLDRLPAGWGKDELASFKEYMDIKRNYSFNRETVESPYSLIHQDARKEDLVAYLNWIATRGNN